MRIRFAYALLIVAVTMSWMTAPRTAAAGLIPGTVERYTLANGLQVVLASDPAAAAVDVAVWYDAGTRLEPAGRTGVAHLFEHLMFRGSARFAAGEHARRIAATGGTFGAFTTADFSSFFDTVPASALETALELEADRMSALVIDAKRLDVTRDGVRVERQLPQYAAPTVAGLQRLYAAAFPTHPYRTPLFGVEADLKRLTLAECRAWYRDRYGPGRAVLTVTGRIDPAEARTLIAKHFGALKGGKPTASPRPKVDLTQSGRRVSERGRTAFRILWTGWTLPGRGDPDLAPLLLLAATLARGEDSRITRTLVEQSQSCVFSDGDLEARADASLLYCMLALAPNADSVAVERELLAEVARLTREPLTPDELEIARRHAESAILFSLQGARGRAIALGTSVTATGDEQDATRQLERIRACTAADIQRVASRFLTAQRRTVVWMAALPGGPRGGAR